MAKKQKYAELTLCISGKPMDVFAPSAILKLAPSKVRKASEYPKCVPEELRRDEWCLTVRKSPCTALQEAFDTLKCILMRPFIDEEKDEPLPELTVPPLAAAADAVRRAAKMLGAKVSLVVVSDMVDGELPELVLTPEDLEFVRRMGAELSFDIGD